MSSSTESQKPIILYTSRTPNGFKATTFLEELRGHYGRPDYEYVQVSLPTSKDILIDDNAYTWQHLPNRPFDKRAERALVYQVEPKWPHPGDN
jgi:hypothetical protein